MDEARCATAPRAAGVLGGLLGVPRLLREATLWAWGRQAQRLEHPVNLECRWRLRLRSLNGDGVLGLQGHEGVDHIVELLVLVVPVVAKPGGGLDEVPPLRREVLHLLERCRDEERGLRVKRRRDHGAHGLPVALGLFLGLGLGIAGAGSVGDRRSRVRIENLDLDSGPPGEIGRAHV